MEKPQPTRLEDIISYTPETYFTDEEVALIRSTFNGAQGNRLLKLIRKALVPTIADPDLPLEELRKDMFMSAVDFTMMPADQVKPIVLGLQFANKVIFGSLIQLKSIANIKEEEPGNRAARRAQDSAK